MAATSASSSRPRVGVSWMTEGQETSERYLRAVRMAAGEPVPLLAGASSWNKEMEGLRGLLLTGGGDIEPRRYGEANSGSSDGVISRRDELEMEALNYCLSRGLPVLGICRGMQFINVALGGSLIQDIRTSIRHSAQERRVSSYHPVRVLAGTALAAIVGSAGQLRVNSRHHQGLGLEQLAPGLRVSAAAEDGIVEGMEGRDGQFLVAVQCHPERLDEVPEMVGIFAALVDRARGG